MDIKKALLACSLIVSGCFFVYAQNAGDVNINLNLCTTLSGNRVCYNNATGQYQIVDSKGRGVVGNANTGATQINGSVGGVPVGIGLPGENGASGAGAGFGSGGSLPGLLNMAQSVLSWAVPFLITLALLAFFWYLIEFIWKGRDNPEEYKKGRSGMFWSILALFVMVAIWGILGLIGNILGINLGGSIAGFRLPGE
jgi:hypothetical protein